MPGIRLIVGLGNPGKQYVRTRHNAGFWLVERFAAREGIGLKSEATEAGLVGRHESSGAWLVLPQTYVNVSGKSVALLAGFFEPAAEILVAHDEWTSSRASPRWSRRSRRRAQRPGRHRGADRSARFSSLGLGIGRPGVERLVADYVLRKPSAEKREAMELPIDESLKILTLVPRRCLAGRDAEAAHKGKSLGLKYRIDGNPNVGRSGLFDALTKAGISAENCPFCTIEPNVGIVEVRMVE